jgi:hypothetical protein
MRKVIIGLSSVIILSFIVLLFVNAGVSPQEVKKAATEKCAAGKCQHSSACTMIGDKTSCDKAKCKEMECDEVKCKSGKCDPATCKSACTDTNKETVAATGCAKACPMHTK